MPTDPALYHFDRNDPYDRTAPIQMVVPQRIASRDYMRSIRELAVPADAIALWYLGQNGFLVKDSTGHLIGIDLYLTNSCATSFPHLPFRLDRQLPIFIEPEDLDVDIFFTTHSHDDHADPHTIRRVKRGNTLFLGPFDSMRVYRECGVPESCCRLIHPGEAVPLGGSATAWGTFAVPTDATDLNHIGLLIEFANGVRFYNSGDTAYAERLARLLPNDVDVCAICMNGNFHNLAATQAAAIVNAIQPRVVVPCHYDMMVNNVGAPETLRIALEMLGCASSFVQMKYYEPLVYTRQGSNLTY